MNKSGGQIWNARGGNLRYQSCMNAPEVADIGMALTLWTNGLNPLLSRSFAKGYDSGNACQKRQRFSTVVLPPLD